MLKKRKFCFDKRGQVSIFVIVAVIIIGLVVGYLVIKDVLPKAGISANLLPVYQAYESCIKEKTLSGISLMETQAGYIEAPEFEIASTYKPFSSQLEFMGFGVPYWYYVSGSNIIKEQVPTKTEMQNQLTDFLENELQGCDFSSFIASGYDVDVGDAKASVSIQDSIVKVSVNQDLSVGYGDKTSTKTSFSVDVESKLGKFYNQARKIYDDEKTSMFLEDYAIDVLYNYAPVNNVEISCSPKVWLKADVEKDLKQALEANIAAIRIGTKGKQYFVKEIPGIDDNVNFLYSPSWTTKIEVEPEDNGVLVAEPIGMQEGLGILGFCYMPYHFIYNVDFPVLVQIYDGSEMFQFPVAVVIDKNKAREAITSEVSDVQVDLCKYMNQEVSVYTYDMQLNPVEADISFKCFESECNIGKTKIENDNAILTAGMPQCANGFILAEAEGYSSGKYQISTNSENSAEIMLTKLYDSGIELTLDGKEANEQALIYFEGQERKVVAWPEQKSVQLSEGSYNVSVYIYKNSSLKIPGTTTQKCMNVPKSGIFGLFGATEEKCVEMNIPEQIISKIVSGGGKAQVYILESELKEGKKLKINAKSISMPKSIDEMQQTYIILDSKILDVGFG